jgi:hypothetical protein
VDESYQRRLRLAHQLLSDLNRCPHGRHRGDACAGWRGPGPYDGGCAGGRSLGNPQIEPGQHIGYSIYGHRIVAPLDQESWGDAEAWYEPKAPKNT